MAASPLHQFATVRIEGAILPADLLQRVAAGDPRLEGLRPEDYHLAGEKLNEAANHAWNRLLPAWEGFKSEADRLAPGDDGLAFTVKRWLLPFWKTLEYGQLDPARPVEIDGKSYPISHLRYSCPIHLVSFRRDLDRRVESGQGKLPSPHGMVQELLNRSADHLWGFVSNGLKLRILRDNIRLTRQAFVEFDLQAMFEGKAYSDFALLWRLCHESRVNAEKPEQCWLERWSKAAQQQGLRALDQLRGGVERAVEALGRGFLNPANDALVARLRAGTLPAQDYYRQLLRVVYRLLFLFVAEDRGLLFDPQASDAARERYARFYSTARLRRLAERLRGTQHADLYQGLELVLSRLGTTGCTELGLPALGGLFDPAGTPDLLGRRVPNADLLDAVRALSVVSDGRSLRPVDYRNLGAEELGSVYESLLELHPRFDPTAGTFALDAAAGNERKTTGSYYTPSELITCLLDSALDPVLAEAASRPEPEAAILALKVCDPACGSGHFMIAAAHRIARRLAAVRTHEEEPAPDAVRHALRDVVGRCVFGVDINPMAVELCQVALWMDALEPGKPLSFLKHHVQCGNSLLGTTPALLAKGIPDEAFEPIEGDDTALCRAFRKQNRAERQGQGDLFADLHPWERLGDVAAAIAALDTLPDDTADDVRAKERQYERLVAESSYRMSGRFLADLWCAAFVWKKTREFDYPITESIFRRVEKSPHDVTPWMYEEVRRLARQYQFLHWHLAFPGVFRPPAKGERAENELTGLCGGFDVVLGNPPWDMMEFNEQEYFGRHSTAIRQERQARRRQGLIKDLLEASPHLRDEYNEHRRQLAAGRHFIQSSGNYPLAGSGRVNLYPLFLERGQVAASPASQLGMIVPTAVAFDTYCSALFGDFVSSGRLRSLLDFENNASFFPQVHKSYRFCLLTLGAGGRTRDDLTFCFYCHDVAELSDPHRRVALGRETLTLCSPNSSSPPLLLGERDAVLCFHGYRQFGVLHDRRTGTNPWKVAVNRLFSLSDGDDLFCSQSAYSLLAEEDRAKWALLLVGKTIHQFDHRYATHHQGDWVPVTLEQKSDPTKLIATQHYVKEAELAERLEGKTPQRWLLGFREVTRSTDERTAIAAVVPRAGCDTSLRNLFTELDDWPLFACMLANVNSFVFDYFVRQKVVGIHLTATVFEQLPVVPPGRYATPWIVGTSELRNWLLPRVLELTYTAWDLKSFAEDCGYQGEPFRWDEDRRFQLCCELDAAFFHLYLGSGEWRQAQGEPDADFARLKAAFPTPRHAVEYVMDTFPVVRKSDEERYGRYRTKQRILEVYDQLARHTATASPLTAPQVNILKAMQYVIAFLRKVNRRVRRDILEAGVVLMIDDGLRAAFLSGRPVTSRKPGRSSPLLLRWLPVALDQLARTNRIEQAAREEMPFIKLGPAASDTAGDREYHEKAAEAIEVIVRLGEQAARQAVEESVDEAANLVPI